MLKNADCWDCSLRLWGGEVQSALDHLIDIRDAIGGEKRKAFLADICQQYEKALEKLEERCTWVEVGWDLLREPPPGKQFCCVPADS